MPPDWYPVAADLELWPELDFFLAAADPYSLVQESEERGEEYLGLFAQHKVLASDVRLDLEVSFDSLLLLVEAHKQHGQLVLGVAVQRVLAVDYIKPPLLALSREWRFSSFSFFTLSLCSFTFSFRSLNYESTLSSSRTLPTNHGC